MFSMYSCLTDWEAQLVSWMKYFNSGKWVLIGMAKWSALNQWIFKPNCIGTRFITRSFLKWFMLWLSSGLRNEQHLPKCCDSLQLLVSHLVLLRIPCFNLLYKNNGHCQSHSFVSVYCHKNNCNKSNIKLRYSASTWDVLFFWYKLRSLGVVRHH